MTYSVAIRTLGTSPCLRQELESIHSQTVAPEKIVIYIAEGYAKPAFTVGREEYVWVRKGMISQRALQYKEIGSDCILLLDDDVRLSPDSVQRMLEAMEGNQMDCVGADTFKNHLMSVKGKLFAAVTGWVFPHYDERWAFKIHDCGSFSYINNPKKGLYLSQSCAGPCSLWKKNALLRLRWEDELWLEKLGFAYGDDMLEFYKLYVNGGRLGILFDSGVENLDAKTASSDHHANIRKFYTRSIASFLVWHRAIFVPRRTALARVWPALSFSMKSLWLLLVNALAAIAARDVKVLWYYIIGLRDGIRFVKSQEYKNLPSYDS